MAPRVTVVGTGYVGLVCGACLAELGHRVTCVDRIAEKIDALNGGEVPIYERGLEEIVARQKAAGNLDFTTEIDSAVAAADLVFIAVGTPPQPKTGNPDMTAVMAVADSVGAAADGFTVLVIKSTVPVGTAQRLEARLESFGKDIAVASNPEFLREGNAVRDFLEAERVVTGSRDERALELVRALYEPLIAKGIEYVVVSPETSELIKFASNAFLATKVAYINEMARLCETVGADVEMVAHGMGLDERIGPLFLKAGPGYGGSCFPKDVLALINAARDAGSPLSIVETVLASNQWHKHAMVTKIAEVLGGHLDGKRIGVLGLAFKSNTDDMREAPAITIVLELVKGGAEVIAYDPKAMENARPLLNGIAYAPDALGVGQDSDAVVVLTEWPEFRDLDFAALAAPMRQPLLIDLRNLVDGDKARAAGMAYVPLGRPC